MGHHFKSFLTFGGGGGWDILELSAVFVLLFYGNFGTLFSLVIYIFYAQSYAYEVC
jgi:hypothetical protein